MMDGIIDAFDVIGSMVFKDGFMPDTDEEGRLIQSEEEKGEYVKRYKEHVKNGEILRFSMFTQISALPCYKSFDDMVNQRRRKEVDRLNTLVIPRLCRGDYRGLTITGV